MKAIPFLFSALMMLTPVPSRAASVDGFSTQRHVYSRGEKATLQVQLSAPTVDAISFDTDGWMSQTVRLQAAQASYTFDTGLLHAGDYTVRAQPLTQGKPTGAVMLFSLTIAAQRNPQRFPVWNWFMGESPNLEWWTARGFNGFRLSAVTDPLTNSVADSLSVSQMQHIFDHSEQLGIDMGAYLYPSLSTHWAELEHQNLRVLLPNDSRESKKIYPREPIVLDHARQTAASWVDRFADYPAWTHTLLNSEYQIPFALNDTAVKLAQSEAHLDLKTLFDPKWARSDYSVIVPDAVPPELQPKDGIIADDNALYRLLQWWWQEGHGTATMNAEMARILKAKRPDVLTWHDPYRLAPVYGSHAGLDIVSSWTDGAFDLSRFSYTTILQAAAQREKQKTMQTITLFLYGRNTLPIGTPTADLLADKPGQEPFFTDGPDYAREATWLVMSQRPDILGFYFAGALTPDNPTLDPFINSPETFDAIGEVSRALIEPYGPTILQCERLKPRVGVLMSAASTWFFNGRQPRGYANERILPYLSLLMMNHVPFDVILDDDVAKGRLSDYDVLVMPRAETLTQSMVRQITDFARQGKKVIADKSLRTTIPGATITDFDFSFISDLDGAALAKGKAITAEEYRLRMEAYADQLHPLLASQVRPVSSASKRVFVNTLQSGDVRYVFLINDERTYGPRFGQWKLIQETGVRQQAQIEIAAPPQSVLYDALARKSIVTTSDGGLQRFDTTLPAARGRLIAVLPEKIGKIELTLPGQATRGQDLALTARILGVSGKVINGSVPLRVEITDPLGRKSEYDRTAATTGSADGFIYTLTVRPALNDPPGSWKVRVTDLLSGTQAESAYQL